MDWINQVGAPDGTTGGSGASADNSGNVFITGNTNAALPGLTQNGLIDYFAVKYISIN